MDPRLVLLLTVAAPSLLGSALSAQALSVREYALQRPADAVPIRDAAASPRLSAGVTIRRSRAPLEDVLREIARQAQIGISYGDEVPRSGVLVSINVSRLRAVDALEAAVRGTPWTLLYAESGQIMVVRRPPALEGIITGRVTAARTGQPVAGASVTVDGTQLGATADTGGVYRVTGVPAGAHSVLARRIGYLPTRRTITVADGESATLDFALEATPTSLEAVVVTGTAGNQMRAAQSAVVASINASDIVSKAPVNTVSDLLTSRVPGITITQGSGTVGASSRINIRGAASISLSNEPLVFIDGVRMQSGQRTFVGLGGQTISALNDINPNDIESIEVVKGPAAATLYGADASAGVIQIITKKGQVGARRFTQSISAEYGTIDPNFTPRPIYGVCSAANVAAGSGRVLCEGQPVGTIVSDNYLVRARAFDDGNLTSLNYSGQGAGDRYGYFVSVGTNDETGTTSDTEAKRRTGRVNLHWLASDRITTDASLGISKNDYRLPKGDQDTYGYLIAQGLANPTTVTAGPNNTLVGGTTQTVEAIRNILNETSSLRLMPSVQVQFNPAQWLTNRFTVGADITDTKATQFYPRNTQNWYPAPGNGANLGAVAATQNNLTIYTVDYLGNIRADLGRSGRFVSDLSFGSQFINTINNSVVASGTGIVTNSANLAGLTTSPVGGQGSSQQKSLGLLMQEQLGIDEKLFLQAGFRMDRNSAFGDNAEWFFLPKVGMSYLLSKEGFWQGLASTVPTLRVRAAYGTTGRSPEPGAGTRTYLTTRFVSPTGAIVPGAAPGNPGNAQLKAERGSEFEVGMDAELFDNRASFELTYYNKRTTDLLLQQPVAPSLGFSSGPFVNLGEVKNQGFEFSATVMPVQMDRISLEATVSGSTLDNEVVSMGDLSPLINSNRIVREGLPLGAFYAYRVRSVDVAANTVTVSNTEEYAGDQLPTFQGNLSTTVRLFDRLQLYALFDRKSGHKIYNLAQQLADRSFVNSAERNLPPEQGGYTAEERLRYLGSGGVYTRESGTTVGAGSVVGPYIEDASFTRFRELSATIGLPTHLMGHLPITGASLTITGRNLGLWTKFRGDPEVLGTGPGSPGTQFTQFFNAELYTLPPTRRWSARVNLQF
jgi:TonB-dependent starch-binding outer membrane protein SusC